MGATPGPSYCRNHCEPHFEEQGLGTPCFTCANRPPELDQGNAFFDRIYTTVDGFRDEWGKIETGPFLDLMNSHGLNAEQKSRFWRKAQAVEKLIQEHLKNVSKPSTSGAHVRR